ncbi:MAG: GTPase HflX [Spirochaetales bacterium]
MGVQLPHLSKTETQASLLELEALVSSLSIQVEGHMVVSLRSPHPRYLLGTGKALQIQEMAAARGIDLIVFDESLSPSQQKNWEQLTHACVIDRQEVILEIFADRAHTREAQLQVELARMEYSLPRLTRKWTHLSRQRGGARGTRGEGETQLELDRRKVLHRIQKCKRELQWVEAQRKVQRGRRIKTGVLQGSLVGYTNAGKSSLLNLLTGSEVLVQDALFATLDPTTRRLYLPQRGEFLLLSDTVGFIQRIPPELIAAFKATLEETILSDFLIHVVDASSKELYRQALTTRAILRDIGVEDKPVITVLNKIDLVADRAELKQKARDFPNSVLVSTKTKEGKEDLLQALLQLSLQIEEGEEWIEPSLAAIE